MNSRAYHRGLSCFCAFLTFVASLPFVPGCTAGGGGGGGSPRPGAVSAAPGQFITLQHPSIVAGSTVEARFEGPNGYAVEVESALTQTGSAKVAVPPYIDPTTGEFRAAEVNVSLVGLPSDQTVMIDALPAVDDSDPGFALRLLLQSAVEQFQAALANLDAIQAAQPEVDAGPASAEISAEIARIEAILAELNSTGRLSVVLPNGETTILADAELHTADQWVVAVLRGAEEELGISGKSALRMQTIPGFGDVQASINSVLDGLKSGLNGGGVLLGLTSLGLTAVGVFGGVPIATVAGAFGLAVTIGSGVYSWGVGVFTDSNSDSFLGLDRPGFDATQEFLSQGVRIATQTASGLGESAINLANAISTALTVKDTMIAAEATTCQAPEEQPEQQKDVVRLQTIAGFCAITAPPPTVDCSDLTPGGGTVCADTCEGRTNNGVCEEPETALAQFAFCRYGTDCTDCGPRPEPTGGCCRGDGCCAITTSEACQAVSGATYHGDLTDCSFCTAP